MSGPPVRGWALVTGASAGIGAAFADALAARGYGCVLVARREERLRAVAERLPAGRSRVLVCDLAPAGAALELRERVRALAVDIDLLVCNAGFGVYGALAEAPADRLAQLVDVDCRSTLLLVRAFLPDMLARRRGAILLVGSTGALVPMPFYAAYGAAKGFVAHLGRSLSAELRGTGVRVLTLHPGPTRTEFFGVADAPGPLGAIDGGADDPERVVREALAALEAGRRTHVAGRGNRVLAGAARFLPAALLERAALRTLRPRAGRRPGPDGGRRRP